MQSTVFVTDYRELNSMRKTVLVYGLASVCVGGWGCVMLPTPKGPYNSIMITAHPQPSAHILSAIKRQPLMMMD